MIGLLASLAFLTAALGALSAIAGTVRRYRDSVSADLGAYRDIATTRDFHFRVVAFGGSPVPVGLGKVRRIGQRPAGRAAVTPAGWREAA